MRLISDLQTQGSYRKMVVRPKGFKFEILRHEDQNEELLYTDPLHPEFGQFIEGKSSKEGKYKALKIEFSLIPSAYATMLIREITRLPTVSQGK